MQGPFQRIRDQIAKNFPKLGKLGVKPGCIAGADMDGMLIELRKQHPDLPVWEKIEHPRDNYFTIHIMPVFHPAPELLQPMMNDLRTQMEADGLTKDQMQKQSFYEERFTHIWVAEVQRFIYQAIGQCTFVNEKGRDGGQPKWFLTMAWLNSAQRNHQVLRNSVPYFKRWHSGFIVGRDHNIVNRSLKKYPEHLRSGSPGSAMYAD